MRKLKVLILHEQKKLKDSMENIGLNFLKDYEFIFQKLEDFKKRDVENYDLYILDVYDDIAFNYLKNKLDLVLLSISIDLGERPSDYIKVGAINFILRPYSVREIKLNLDKLKNYLLTKYEAEDNKLKFYTLLDNIPYMAWFKNLESEYMIVNKEFKEHCGKDFETIKGRGDEFVWDGMIGEQCRLYDLQVMCEKKRIVFDEVIPGQKGYRQFNIYKVPVINSKKEIKGTMGIAKDITDLKNKNVEFDILLENIPFSVFMKSPTGFIIKGNREFLDLIKEEKDYFISKEEDFVGYDHKESIDIEDKDILNNKKSINVVRMIKDHDNTKILEVYKSPVIDISGEVIGIVCTMKDITEMKNQEKKIREMAYTDPLTELDNRRSLYEYINNELIEGQDKLSVMFIDLDNFKQLNDKFGHLYGDKILIDFSKELKDICKDGFISRIGGDEFVLVWKGELEKEYLSEKADVIIENLKNNNRLSYLSASVGIVTGSIGKETVDSFLAKGDLALYKAKEQGKNQYVFYNKALDKQRCFDEEIENDLKNALEKKELTLHYQAQYNTQGQLFGFESLLRWNNEKYKKIPIINIISIIEKTTLIDDIGDFILEEAFSFSKKINTFRENKIVISVNISALQIMKSNFVKNIKKILNKIDVDPKIVGIEITETVLLKNIEENLLKIKELKDIGITISLDDFGTGYSSFCYLVKLPLTNIKLDKNFIWGMKDSDEYKTLVKLCVDTAHALNLKIVAEGVETTEELDILKKMNVDFIQGYLFSKPIPENKVIELLKIGSIPNLV